MVSVTILISVFVATVTARAVDPQPESNGIPGYEMTDIKWEFQPKSDGPKVFISGTVDHVHEELSRRYPNWKEESEPAKDVLAKRTDFPYNDVICDVFQRGDPYWIGEAVKALKEMGGKPSLGPKQCGRVSCQTAKTSVLNFIDKIKTGSVFWCNDTDQPKTLESHRSIVDGAVAIQNKCEATVYSGQAFHPTGWNVILRQQDKC